MKAFSVAQLLILSNFEMLTYSKLFPKLSKHLTLDNEGFCDLITS